MLGKLSVPCTPSSLGLPVPNFPEKILRKFIVIIPEITTTIDQCSGLHFTFYIFTHILKAQYSMYKTRQCLTSVIHVFFIMDKSCFDDPV